MRSEFGDGRCSLTWHPGSKCRNIHTGSVLCNAHASSRTSLDNQINTLLIRKMSLIHQGVSRKP